MLKIEIKINTDNSAFTKDKESEIMRIVNKFFNESGKYVNCDNTEVSGFGCNDCEHTLTDSNGNKVGTIELIEATC